MSRVAYDEVEVNGDVYVVSTINRQSSCMYGGTYAETMVFTSGRQIWQGEDCEDYDGTHNYAVNALKSGKELAS